MPTAPKTFEQRRAGIVERSREIGRKDRRAVYNSTAWQRLRLVVLAEEPICKVCGERPSTDVDHIKPLALHPKLALVRENLQGVCEPCHGAKTREEERVGANGGSWA